MEAFLCKIHGLVEKVAERVYELGQKIFLQVLLCLLQKAQVTI